MSIFDRGTSKAAFFACALLSCQVALGAVIPADRANNWYQAGVPGGIPSGQNIYTTLSPGATAAQINSALNSCPSNSVVYLSAGTYNLGGSRISIAKDGVVLRGATNSAGFPATKLNNTDIKMARSSWPSEGNWSNIRALNIASGLAEGSTSITLGSPVNTDFAVGDLFIIDQLYDGTQVKNSSVTWAHRPNRPYCFVAQCTGISGNTVSFQPPLVGEYWSSALSPQAFGWSSLYGHTLHRAGLENVDVVPNGNLYNIMMGPAYGCWARNVRTGSWPTGGGSAGLRMTYSLNCSLFWSIFHDVGQVSNSSYAVYPVVVTACSVEGNIFTNLALAMPCISAVSCSFSYNYATGPYPYSPSAWLAEYFFPHGGHTHDTLYEGNWLEAPIYLDAVFGGNNSRMAIARNRIKGWANTKTGNTVPITLEADMDNVTILGNVLGQSGYHSSYSQMYSINSTCAGTVKKGNYNTVNGAVNAAELLTGTDTIADSYRYAGKPGWFGNLPWPSFSLSAASASDLAFTNLPAGYRNYYGKEPPSSGGNLSPVVAAGATPTSGTAPLTAAFSSAGSYDPEGVSLSYSWVFGDGGTSALANPSHTYSTAGTYSARLTVSDGVNSAISGDITIIVTSSGTNRPPVVVASANALSGNPPLAVSFSSAGSYDPEGVALSYNWTFGDGASSTAANPTHTYSSAGSYSVQLRVSDGTNTASSDIMTITVTNPLPTISLSSPANGASFSAPASINLTATVAANGHTISSVRFFNGTALLGQDTAAPYSLTWTNSGVGSYTLTAQVVYDSGATITSAPVNVSVMGLVAAFGFEEIGDAIVGDSSGNGNAGRIAGATWSRAGRFGNALLFGSGALVTISNSASLALSTALTLEAWVNPTSISADWMNVIFKSNGDPGSQNPCYVLQGSNPSNSSPSFFMDGTTGNLNAPSPLGINTWTHMAVTWDGTTVRLYLNGAQVSSQARTGVITTSAEALTIGGNLFSGQNWNGLIDEVRIYNRALTQSELQNDMNTAVSAPRPAAPTGLRIASVVSPNWVEL